MTKRFELRLCNNGIYYVYENGTLTDIDFDKFNKENAYALIDKVNALYDENRQLRKENDMLSCELSVSANKEISRNCRIAELEEENEQLKQENEKLQGEYDYLLWLYNGLGCEYDWLKEENEQLKKKSKRSYYIL